MIEIIGGSQSAGIVFGGSGNQVIDEETWPKRWGV
jgi:hypothetical protein